MKMKENNERKETAWKIKPSTDYSLLKKHGDRLRPVACFSSKLDPVVAGFPFCLCAVAAAEKAVTASRNIVGYSNLTLLVPHAVSLLLLEKKTSHLSAQRWLKYNTVILDMPNIIVKCCTVLNPASLFPTEDDGEPHDYVALTNDFCSPRADLKSNPLENPDMVLYVDGSASRNPETGKNKVKEALPKPTEGPLHDLQPGDWIVVKDFRRTKWNKPRWNGPFQVLLTTPLAVKVTGRVTWIHASHCRRVPEPAEQEEKEGLNDPDAGKAREEERHHCMKQCEYHINHARTLNREEYFSV
ncbi:uncharacterized protein LOC132875024 isoform X2 [Neoarius graeffei]|uniref:uncharacterized protein LOC132875024 isoform X2 n=1 Tax=Neoarius graeffei TaxID=443677 RepID=UPI00298C4806|nr:uncharacterized protein LOC132875024 isoform X2 [Neoarius graeffei]XP_060767571.1 uncharacterized protein LOC132875024 isoform X2 [Neoarius graeffei]